MDGLPSYLDIWPDIDAVLAHYEANTVLDRLRTIAAQTECEKQAVAERSLETRDRLLQTAAGWTG